MAPVYLCMDINFDTTISEFLYKEIRGKSLFYALEFDPKELSGEQLCSQLMAKGILVRFHHNFLLLAPPFVIKKSELQFAIDQIEVVLAEIKLQNYSLENMES
jgi:acetylornithine/succinyldiaminopimelate/putrescine aminotransferase